MSEELLTSTFDLPAGYLDKDGNLHTDVEIREFTGEIELIANDRRARNEADVVAKVLQSVLVRIGSIETITPMHIRRMYAGDADYCLIKARQLSRGDLVQGKMRCAECGETLDIEFSMADLVVNELSDDQRKCVINGKLGFEIPDGLIEGVSAAFRYQLFEDTMVVAKLRKVAPGNIRHQLFANCCLKWNDEKVPLAANFFSMMPQRILGVIEDEFLSRAPGPELDIDVPCGECGWLNTVDLDKSDFFFPQRQNRRKHL